MRKLQPLVFVGAAAFAMAALSGTALASDSEGRSAGTEVSSAPAAAGWNHGGTWGQSAGTVSASGGLLTKATGFVRDDAADGKCVQTIFRWYYRGGLVDTDYSPRACPKGDRDDFTKAPGDGGRVNSDSVDIFTRLV